MMLRWQVLALALMAGCVPRDFPENPFEVTEGNLTAPEVVPLDTGFPGAQDLAAARETEAEAFALGDDADALSARTQALAERDPAASEDLRAPAGDPDALLRREDTLRARAAELRARDDVAQPTSAEELQDRRDVLDAQAEILRTRTD